MSEILVVTSASGRQNAQLLPLLTSSKRFKLRLASHSEASASKLRMRYPGAEVVVVDLTSLDACRDLVRGATTVYHVGPSIHSREREMGFNMIDAATAEFQGEGSQFKHFVFSSVLGTQHRKLMQHDLKSFVEERLMLSPIPWTILQPTNFMDAYPVARLASMETPVMERLWKPDMPNSMIALKDLAEAAAKVLTEREKHFYAQYPLSSTLPTTDAEVFEAISKKIGKDVQFKTPTFEVGVDNLLSLLFGTSSTLSAEGDLRPDVTRDEAERLILFYNRYSLAGNPNVLRWLLGREPTTVEQWVKLQLDEAKLI
ncbi:NmrA-like family protein [Colletotrichum karsti]|uniref:NmrA-like family protein n=1 Tax=Colletotrichum karsti TaxID=1095194 RepID=A0A9P6LKZ1_9PEZI|nr:NmrA-like family protein [Colletotrichum karsti]KAF9876630.1 NmrA-like family protein [Colletotrichum karsti]